MHKASIQIIIKKECNTDFYQKLFLNNFITYLVENLIPYTFSNQDEFNTENEVDVKFIVESFIKNIDNLILKNNDEITQQIIKELFVVKHRLNSQVPSPRVKSWDDFKYYFNNLSI
jgi:hypothetical protein